MLNAEIMIGLPMEEDLFIKKVRTQISDCILKENCTEKSFEYTHFINFEAKNREFRNVNFKYCMIEDSYFHQAKFYDCDFTGSIIKNSNFRNSKFERCHFNYTQFQKTILPYDEVLHNLPSYENVRLTFLKNIRINADEIGEKDVIEKLILAEAETLTKHYKKAFVHDESYYKNKYKGFLRVQSFFKYLGLKIKKILWNHGYSYFRILFLSFTIIFILAFINTIKKIDNSSTLYKMFLLFGDTLKEALFVYIDYFNLQPEILNHPQIIFIIILRYITFGLIINILYVKNKKK